MTVVILGLRVFFVNVCNYPVQNTNHFPLSGTRFQNLKITLALYTKQLLSTKWVDYVEKPMKYQALRPQFFSMGGWVGVGVVGGWWWGGVGRDGGGRVGGGGVGWVVLGCRVVEGWWVVWLDYLSNQIQILKNCHFGVKKNHC